MPKNLKCPNCDRPSIGYWQKQFLGPGRTIPCKLCGARISVSWIHFLPVLLIVAAFPVLSAFGLLEHGLAPFLAVAAILLLAIAVYQHYVVTLVVRSRPE